MGFVNQPSLVALPSNRQTKSGDVAKRYGMNFSYNFAADSISAQNAGGITFLGTSFSVSSSQVQNPVSDLTFRTLLFTIMFDGQGSLGADVVVPEVDGPCIITIPSTGQIHAFAMDQSNLPENSITPPTSENGFAYMVTGAIPIISGQPTIMKIYKGISQKQEQLAGTINCLLVTDEIDPWIEKGFSALISAITL